MAVESRPTAPEAPPAGESAAGRDELAQLAAQLLEAWNAHDADRAARLHAADYEGLDVAEATPQRGTEGVRRSLARYLCAFPDLSITSEETVVDGARIVLAWTARGTHRGALMNIPATGRAVQVRGVLLLTTRRTPTGREIARGFCVWDVAGFLRAIGLLPEL